MLDFNHNFVVNVKNYLAPLGLDRYHRLGKQIPLTVLVVPLGHLVLAERILVEEEGRLPLRVVLLAGAVWGFSRQE